MYLAHTLRRDWKGNYDASEKHKEESKVLHGAKMKVWRRGLSLCKEKVGGVRLNLVLMPLLEPRLGAHAAFSRLCH